MSYDVVRAFAADENQVIRNQNSHFVNGVNDIFNTITQLNDKIKISCELERLFEERCKRDEAWKDKKYCFNFCCGLLEDCNGRDSLSGACCCFKVTVSPLICIVWALYMSGKAITSPCTSYCARKEDPNPLQTYKNYRDSLEKEYKYNFSCEELELENFPLLKSYKNKDFLKVAEKAWNAWNKPSLKLQIELNIKNKENPAIFFHLINSYAFSVQIRHQSIKEFFIEPLTKIIEEYLSNDDTRYRNIIDKVLNNVEVNSYELKSNIEDSLSNYDSLHDEKIKKSSLSRVEFNNFKFMKNLIQRKLQLEFTVLKTYQNEIPFFDRKKEKIKVTLEEKELIEDLGIELKSFLVEKQFHDEEEEEEKFLESNVAH